MVQPRNRCARADGWPLKPGKRPANRVSFTLPDLPKSEAPPEVLALAARLGTKDEINRTPQYQGDKWSQPHELLRTVNVQGNHIRGVQAEVGRVQHQIYNLQLRNSIVVAIVTALLVKAPEIAAWGYALLK